MQSHDRWPEEHEPEGQRLRLASRKDSLMRRGSRPLSSAPPSASSTPKKSARAHTVDLLVTGKQILKKCDRASSLPGGYHKRPSSDSAVKSRRPADSPTKLPSQPSNSLETSLEDDVSIDLSQISDYEEPYSRRNKFIALATSTPKPTIGPRSKTASQGPVNTKRLDSTRGQMSLDSKRGRESVFSNDTFKTSTSGSLRCGGELDYSSVSPEYSGQSSVELSPRTSRQADLSESSGHVSSCCVSTWQVSSDAEVEPDNGVAARGEWDRFWASYNSSVSRLAASYDPCPTPYRPERTAAFLHDFDVCPESPSLHSPENLQQLNCIIRAEGLHLTPRETQNMIRCAHVLGNVLSAAIGRRAREHDATPQNAPVQDMEREVKKKAMTLNLRETHVPLEVREEKRWESITTQTDISLPNTRSAPKIFENILRQLSKSSIDDANVFDNKQTYEENVDSAKKIEEDKGEKVEIHDGQ